MWIEFFIKPREQTIQDQLSFKFFFKRVPRCEIAKIYKNKKVVNLIFALYEIDTILLQFISFKLILFNSTDAVVPRCL